MKLSFCIFSAQYLPNYGGVEKYTHSLAKKLIQKGHTVIIVTSQIRDLSAFEVIDGSYVYRLQSFSLLNGRFPIVKNNKSNKKTLNKLKNMKFDHIIVNTRFYFLSLLGVHFAFENHIPCLVIEHGTGHLTINNPFFDLLGQRFEHYITKQIKKYCQNFYGVSEACNKWLLHFGIESKGTLYNAVDLDYIESLLRTTKTDFRKKYNISPNDTIVCFTGRLIKEKGVLKLLRAVKGLLVEQNNIFLFFAGDGPLLKHLKHEQNRNIHVLGRLKFPQIIDLLKSADIVCLPTDYPEGFPTSVLEAVAVKCFIITTDKGGSKELVSSKDLGIIMKTNSIDEIYESIKYAVNNSDYRRKAVELCYKKLREHFTWEITANKVINIALEEV